MPRVHVFVGASLDGFIAGPNDELDWLAGGGGGEPESPDSFGPFFAQIGAVLMGRRTYDVVRGMSIPWPYGETPMLIATHRPLPAGRPTVRAASGTIEQLVAEAKQAAGARDVYVDGGQLIRAALDAGLVDELTVTVVPMVLGAGLPLFAGAARRHPLELLSERRVAGEAVELRYRPRR
jgi:dihydrofolate reductase